MNKLIKGIYLISLLGILTGFIGGSRGPEPIDGLVTLNGPFGPCTGIFVSQDLILTAMHCISKVPSAIIGNDQVRVVSGPHFPTDIQLGIFLNGQFKQGLIKLSGVSFFVDHYHKNVKDISTFDIQDLYKLGDFALLKLQTPIPESVISKNQIAKIGMIDPESEGEVICVGGCGYQGSFKTFQFPEPYRSSLAILGKRENLLRAHISNIGDDISFLGPGDSGGPVILKTTDGPIVIGLNHSIEVSSVSDLHKIQLDKKTGEITSRPDTPWAHEIGNFHLFFQDNLDLKAWLLEQLDYTPIEHNQTRCERAILSHL